MKRILNRLPILLPHFFSLWILLLLQRLYEAISLDYPSYENGVPTSYILTGIFYDLFLAFVVLGFFNLIQLIVFQLVKINIYWLFHLFSLVVILVNFTLIESFIVMKTPLDELIFLFSWNELKLIIGIEGRLSPLVICSILLMIVGYFLLAKGLKKLFENRIKNWSFRLSILSLFAVVLLFFVLYRNDNKPDAVALINNKLTYFGAESMAYFMAKDEVDTTKVQLADFQKLDVNFLSSRSVSEQYPLMHELPEKNVFSSHFRKIDSKPPHIVILIVESLSSDLVGIRADRTGHLMPFLDSLSEQSLYFPNFLSTCERTHNVLPAVLSSVPNAPNGKALQHMKTPEHWSLVNVLKKNYYSRFYCGVRLGYCNMAGYMNYLQTDYLVSNWKMNPKPIIDGRKNNWGFPDEDIYAQSIFDLKMKKEVSTPTTINTKSRLDIFLTISTHDPFVYPESAKYEAFVKQQLSKLDQQKSITKQLNKYPRELGTFSYADASIRDFMKNMKQFPDFENTIFIITGDHGTELCLFDELSRYKVPLIVYSPLLKKAKTIESVSTHLDIAPTLLNFLRLNYLPELPKEVPFIGQEIDMRANFHTNRMLALGSAQFKNPFLFKNGYVLLNNLCKVDKRLTANPIQDKNRKKKFQNQLEIYNLFSRYTLEQNRVISDFSYRNYVPITTFNVLYKYKKQPASLTTSNSFISIGEMPDLPQGTHTAKLVVTCEMYVNSESDIIKTPEMIFYMKHKGELKKKLLSYSVQPECKTKSNGKSWTKLTYVLDVPITNDNWLTQTNSTFYLYNPKRHSLKLKNFNTVISHDSKVKKRDKS